MPRRKPKDTLDHLGPTECAQVLRELLERVVSKLANKKQRKRRQ